MGFWYRLKEKHPIIYEVIQWVILVMAVAAVFKDILY